MNPRKFPSGLASVAKCFGLSIAATLGASIGEMDSGTISGAYPVMYVQ